MTQTFFKPTDSEFQEISNFGSNPSGLKMYIYKPKNLQPNSKLVFVLHGCTESASKIRNSGWDDLAIANNIIVVYPEDPNISFYDDRCFNWFSINDITKNSGQASSIYSMLTCIKQNFSIDSEKVFILGLSAGGYFASLIATLYPNEFKAFASIAAGPTRCYPDGVSNLAEITKCTSGYGLSLETVSKTALEWGNFVRNTNPSVSS